MSVKILAAAAVVALVSCNAVLGLAPSTLESRDAGDASCKVACPLGGGCVSGQCVCPGGQIACADVCTSLQSDSNNCAACGNVCAGVCTVSHCLVTLATDSSAGELALDSSSAYWTNRDSIVKVPLLGGAPTAIVSQQDGPHALALGGGDVYWATGNLLKAPSNGGSVATVGTDEPRRVVLDATNAYYTTYNYSGVEKVPLEAGTPVVLASVTGSTPTGIAVDSSSVYWTGYGDDTVMKVALAGGTPTTLATGQMGPRSIAVDAKNLYWTTQGGGADGTVMKMLLDGGSPVTLASAKQIDSTDTPSMALDGTNVYFATDTQVMKVSIDGGEATVIASDRSARSLAVDSSSVYWIDDQGIVKLTPK